MPRLGHFLRNRLITNPEVVASHIASKSLSPSEELVCTVCTDKVSNIEPAKLPCGHGFHTPCCQASLKASMRCPNCRQNPYLAQPWRLESQEKVLMAPIVKINGDHGQKENFIIFPPKKNTLAEF